MAIILSSLSEGWLRRLAQPPPSAVAYGRFVIAKHRLITSHSKEMLRHFHLKSIKKWSQTFQELPQTFLRIYKYRSDGTEWKLHSVHRSQTVFMQSVVFSLVDVLSLINSVSCCFVFSLRRKPVVLECALHGMEMLFQGKMQNVKCYSVCWRNTLWHIVLCWVVQSDEASTDRPPSPSWWSCLINKLEWNNTLWNGGIATDTHSSSRQTNGKMTT